MKTSTTSQTKPPRSYRQGWEQAVFHFETLQTVASRKKAIERLKRNTEPPKPPINPGILIS